MYCKILRNTVLWTDFSASCREINRFSVSKIGPEPAKPMISLALLSKVNKRFSIENMYQYAVLLYCTFSSEQFCSKLVLGIGQENHNRLSEELNRLIIDCTIGFLFAVSNNIQRSLKEYQKPEHVCSWHKTDCQKCTVIISCQRCKVIQFTVKNHQ